MEFVNVNDVNAVENKPVDKNLSDDISCVKVIILLS